METIEKMLVAFAWIVSILGPIIFWIKVWMQSKYEGSLEETIDRINGRKGYYTGGLLYIAIFSIIAIVFLAVR